MLFAASLYPFQPREPLLLFSSVAILTSVVTTAQDHLFDSRGAASERTKKFSRVFADFRRHYGFLLSQALHVERAMVICKCV